MPRHNYRKNPSYARASKPWLWLLVGLLIGALVMFLTSFQYWLPWINKEGGEDKTATILNGPRAKEASTDQTAHPRFEFYTLLPEMEVTVPELKQSPSQPQSTLPPQPKVKASPKSSPAKSASSEAYVLQAGSFRNYTQADKRKADLALIGVEATIQTVTINNSKTWHRVRIGPSTDLSKLNQIRQQLRQNHIESRLFKVKL